MTNPLSDENRKTLERSVPPIRESVAHIIRAKVRLVATDEGGYEISRASTLDAAADILSAIRPDTRVEDTVGAAEREVGRYIYRRIEALMEAAPGTAGSAELEYLSKIAASVEEFGEKHCAGTSLADFPHPAPPIPAEVEERAKRLEMLADCSEWNSNGVIEFSDAESASRSQIELRQTAQDLRALAVQVGETQKANRAVMDRLSEVSDDRGRVCAERDTLKADLSRALDEAASWKTDAASKHLEVERLREALEPFGKAGGLLGPAWLDHETHWQSEQMLDLRVGDLRRARAALNTKGGA